MTPRTFGVDAELLADLRNTNRAQTAELIETLHDALIAIRAEIAADSLGVLEAIESIIDVALASDEVSA